MWILKVNDNDSESSDSYEHGLLNEVEDMEFQKKWSPRQPKKERENEQVLKDIDQKSRQISVESMRIDVPKGP